ncbi:MAG: endopeptidase La [Candidatus Hydrogenedens sp.]|nr:endopeptidase La [Candidatus Hydrogenedens sp.]
MNETRESILDPKGERLPVLPLKDAVVYPRMVLPLLVGRPDSVEAVDVAIRDEVPLFLCTQRDATVEEPNGPDLFRVGTIARIIQTLRMPDGTVKLVVEGLARGRVRRFYTRMSPIEALVHEMPPPRGVVNKETRGLMRTVLALFEEYVRLTQRVAPEVVMTLQDIEDPDALVDTCAAYLPIKMAERQQLLETSDPKERLSDLNMLLVRENELSEIERTVRDRVREQMERGQREHFLHEQLKAIHQELGSREEGGDEFSELRQLIDKAGMPKEVWLKADREFARYARMPVMSPESGVIRSYLEALCDVPWTQRSDDTINLDRARKVLDADHYALAKVKERIVEFLAVRKLQPQSKGPILCLVGPPGVGKTSLGESIARAMNREFVRMSLGGVRDEAEIRGHRRTYIGALPGRIIQGMVRAKVRNPVFMLDEIDKMSNDFRGDPSSAMLEVLDPAQNHAFSDHYLEVDYDLSEVFFIATANNEYDIPHALHDRMEVVRLSGYTQDEKEHIAKLFLLPKQREACGLAKKEVALTKAGLDTLIQRYTREAGVRELERQIASLCRKAARLKVDGQLKSGLKADPAKVIELLGPPVFSAIRAEVKARVGVAVGMAWTQSGGDVLTIETSLMPGKGKLTLTGRLGDVMKESAETAFSYLRAHAKQLNIEINFDKETDIHIHVPEGATPKDGPSAGTALVVSMLSALRDQAPAAALSMTGEITLSGRVLAVGGIKEKVISAHRAGIRRVILPLDNEKDLAEVPVEVRKAIRFEFVAEVAEVIRIAFSKSGGK